MDLIPTKERLKEIKGALDSLLAIDRTRLNASMRQVRKRIHENQPTDRLHKKLNTLYTDAKQRIEKRNAIHLTIDYPKTLPVTDKKDNIKELIKENQVVIVCGTTGSGKTTQLPKIAREAGAGTTGRIGITQPRRLAATGMARRVAEEMKSPYGKGVGCQVRFDDQTTEETIIKFMTDGILLAETQHDRHLLQYDCLIIDEAHERSLNIDFILGYLKNLLPVRPDLKVIISSATLDAESFSTFFNDAPVIEVEGRVFPVEDYFLPPNEDEELSNHILRAVRWISDIDEKGDILIFLPGEREIRDATKKLNGHKFPDTEVLPLFGRLSMAEQQRVFKPAQQRRIILATNVAETSITIPRIHYVIDSGLVRLSRYNPQTQVQGLQIEQVSQASARQRRGRCGRITDGICIYLYDEETLENSAAYTDPEIKRTSLAGVILHMDVLGLPPIDQFPLIDPPQPARIREGLRTLKDLGAINHTHKLTPTGREISQFPTDPHLARMILQAHDEGAIKEILILVAFLSIQDVRERPTEKADQADLAHKQWIDPRSDFLTILTLWNALQNANKSGSQLRKYCRTNFLNYRRVQEWNNLWRDLRQTIRSLKWKNAHSSAADITKNQASGASRSKRRDAAEQFYAAIHRSLLAGLPANIGQKSNTPEFQAARNRKFYIFPGSALFKKPPEWVLTFSLVETTRLFGRIVAEIDPAWLETVAPHLCKSTYSKPAWNGDAGFVYAKESIISGGLTLITGRNVHFGPIDPPLARELFIKEALIPGTIKTHQKWLKLHLKMLDEIALLEEKIRRPDSLLHYDALFEHFDRKLPPDVYSTKSLENWIRKTKARIAMRFDEAIIPQTTPIRTEDYPDQITYLGETFPLVYTLDPGEELDGVALICPTERMILLPTWSTDWLIPGWLPEKVNRLLRTLPKNLRASCMPIDRTAALFIESVTPKHPEMPLLDALVGFLQQTYSLPVDTADFKENTLPNYMRMKVIETENEQIVQVHTHFSDEHKQSIYRNSTEAAFAKWSLPPQKSWPGNELPEFIVSGDSTNTRGYPALYVEGNAVGRNVFLSQNAATFSHTAGLVKLFRLAHADQVRYVEKRPPLSTKSQLVLSALDPEFLTDFFDSVIYDALTKDGQIDIRSGEAFTEQALSARSELYEYATEAAEAMNNLLDTREQIAEALDPLPSSDSKEDIDLQLAFLFRPGFITTPDLYARYPRYLRAIQLRLQRLKNNQPADLRKLAEIIPFQDRLNHKLLESENIAEEHDLIHFAMMLEEFRVNRFAPEIKTNQKISANRLEKLWNEFIDGHFLP